MSAASDTVKQTNSLLDSVDELLPSPNWEQRMPVVLKLADGVESESEEFINHAFSLGIALMLILFLGMSILIRYASSSSLDCEKSKELPKEWGVAISSKPEVRIDLKKATMTYSNTHL